MEGFRWSAHAVTQEGTRIFRPESESLHDEARLSKQTAGAFMG